MAFNNFLMFGLEESWHEQFLMCIMRIEIELAHCLGRLGGRCAVSVRLSQNFHRIIKTIFIPVVLTEEPHGTQSPF